MGLRFQKRIQLFKGLTLNLSKTGASFTLGGPGASLNVRGDKVTGSVGLPGTGISYRKRLDKIITAKPKQPTNAAENTATQSNIWKWLAILLLIAFLLTLAALLAK